jgi:hypothetical protein
MKTEIILNHCEKCWKEGIFPCNNSDCNCHMIEVFRDMIKKERDLPVNNNDKFDTLINLETQLDYFYKVNVCKLIL